MYDTDLAEMVEGINCLQKIFVIDACFSGGFVDDLYGPKSSVQTCISVDKGITMAQNFGYTKLPYAYGTALKGYHPEGGQPWINSEYEIGEADLGDIYGPWDDLDDINPDEAEGLSINDGNQDGYIQLGETFEYCRYLDYEIFNYGENHINHGFDDADDLLTCAGLCGIVTETQTVEGNFIIGKNLSVSEAVTLTIDDYSKFFLNDSVSFNIVEGGEVEINDNVEFWGFGETSVFEIYGDASFGSNFSLKAPTELTWTGVKFINESTDYTVAGATIENCTLFGNCKSLEVDGCTFNNAKLEIAYGDLTVDNNSEFNTSWIYAGHPNDGHSSVIIDNCDFDNSSLENLVSIDIDDYFSYKITDCSIIDNADGPCISLYNAGSIRTSTTEEDDIIKNCTIRSTSGIRDDYPSSGVQIYTSYCTLDSNWIYNNDHGVRCLNNSSIEIIGYENSSAEDETQRIKNNDEVQVFSTENSFPTTFTYNSISGPQDSWYVYTSTSACTTAIFDIDYNYWGGLDCTELEDYLHPDGCYKCDNVWDPSWAKKNFDIVKAKYDSVTTLIDSGLYSDAESQLKMIIYDYPESKFASAAVKDLFYLKEIHDQDYSGLQTYYDTAVNLQNEDELDKLSKFFANRCDIKLENYQNAIDWYDAIILNPDTLEDSVFAVIDRDYVTMLMQMDSSRKGIIIPDYPGKPVSYDEFMIKREELLKLLTVPLYTPYGIEESNENEFVDSNIDFIGNYPNPFHTKTTFSFNLKNEARVKIQIFNQLGMMVSEVTDGLLKEGEHNIQFFNTTLSPGIYILKLTMNELYTIGKKIIIY